MRAQHAMDALPLSAVPALPCVAIQRSGYKWHVEAQIRATCGDIG